MGFTHRTYVGPYVRCAVGTVEVTKQRRSCINKGCVNHERTLPQRDAFCVVCGSPVGDVPYTATEAAVDDWAVREQIEDRLTTASGDAYMGWSEEQHAHLWVPNVATPGRDYWTEERTDFSVSEITAEQVLEERSAFTVFFQGEIEALRSFYGAAAVSVHWGIVQDYI